MFIWYRRLVSSSFPHVSMSRKSSCHFIGGGQYLVFCDLFCMTIFGMMSLAISRAERDSLLAVCSTTLAAYDSSLISSFLILSFKKILSITHRFFCNRYAGDVSCSSVKLRFWVYISRLHTGVQDFLLKIDKSFLFLKTFWRFLKLDYVLPIRFFIFTV